jgi:hypothetical protein
MRREKNQISRIRNAKGEITTNTMEVQEIIRDYFENLYSNKFKNLKDFQALPVVKVRTLRKDESYL